MVVKGLLPYQTDERRPVVTEWNATLSGDYLWTNLNVGEVFPRTTTPSTWPVWQELLRNMSLGDIPAYGNIAGRRGAPLVPRLLEDGVVPSCTPRVRK
jgi:hypothetical protein